MQAHPILRRKKTNASVGYGEGQADEKRVPKDDDKSKMVNQEETEGS